MKKALVLCGGGSKGAYEIGAWKALEELGEKFNIVTGTSIGCLNAAMYVQHEFKKCEELWDLIKVTMIMNGNLTLDGLNVKQALKEQTDLVSFLKKYVKYRGSDITPFLRMLDEYLDPEKIVNSDVDFGIVTVMFPSFKPVEVRAKDLNKSEVIKYILASTSCFPVFPVCKIKGQGYVDGGYYDNLPINFALNMGATEIVAVDLNYSVTHPEYLNKPYIRYIKPSWNLGGFMMFEDNHKQSNKTLGYNDTMKSYAKLDGFRYTFFINEAGNKISKTFVLFIANIVAQLRSLRIKTYVKPEIDGDIFKILEAQTYRSLSDYDYYLRATEIAAEFFCLDHLKIYELSDLTNIILDNLFNLESSSVNIFTGYQKLKNINKQKEFISRVDEKKLLKHLIEEIIGGSPITNDFIQVLASAKPIVFIIFAFIYANKEIIETKNREE